MKEKPHYQAYEISVSKKRSGAIETYLDSHAGTLISEHLNSLFKGPDAPARYYIVRGCTAVHLEKGKKAILRIIGTKENLEEVIADIKEFAPELRLKQIRI